MKARSLFLSAYIIGAAVCLAVILEGPPEARFNYTGMIPLILVGLMALFAWHVFA